jgi:hypothetical protein
MPERGAVSSSEEAPSSDPLRSMTRLEGFGRKARGSAANDSTQDQLSLRLRTRREKRGRTVDNILIVSSIGGLIRLPHELLNLVLELAFERRDLLKHDAELDQRVDDFSALCGGE